MPTTVVGLYRTEADVQRVSDDLSSHGFSTGEINRHDEASSGLRSWLIDQGVPETEAEDYILGVRNGGKLVTLEASDDRADEAVRIMQRHESGTAAGTAGATADTSRTTQDRPRTTAKQDRTADRKTKGSGEETLEVVEEELDVGKRAVEGGGVRVKTYVTERPVEEKVKLREERVEVDRRPVDRSIGSAEAEHAFEEKAVEMTERSEEAVVAKRARVVEEVVLSKDVRDRTETVKDTVRRTDVEVERADDVLREDKDHFRTHHRDTLGGTDHDYDDREPAYRYGIDLANHPDYRDRSWSEVAPDARTHWERQNAGTWNEFESAIRYGYEHAHDRSRKRR
jgi:stress response protein YsnF